MRRGGAVRRFGLMALLIALSVSFAQSADARRRIALIVGNSAYRHTAPLANPRNDALDIGAALKKLDFEVIQGLDVDKAAFDRNILEFASALQGAEAGLFFFAGHGLQVAGQNYLIPVDAKLESTVALDFETVSVNVVQRAMESATDTNLLFLDACRNNPLARNLARAMGTRSAEISRGFAPVVSGIGTLISFSTQPGNVALDGTGRNSPFAAALVKELSAPTDDLSAMLIDVRNDVMRQTRNKQVPWEHSSLTGRFYFGATPSTYAPAETKQSGSSPSAVTTTDEVAWSLIKDTRDLALLRRFIEQFPTSRRRADAERRASGIAPSPKRADQAGAREQKSPGGVKCFTFDGRQFCE
jgi:uncharacterized caspase-like protein